MVVQVNLYSSDVLIRLRFIIDTPSTTTTTTTTSVAPTTTSQATTDACHFVHPEKGVINLSFIGRTDEKAAYSDEITRTTSNFSMF